MNKPLAIFTAIIFLAGQAAAQIPSNLKKDRLIGAVKIIRTEKTWVSEKTGKPEESKRVLMLVEKYDPSGNKTEWAAYRPEASYPVRIVFVYDSKGKVIEEKTFNSADEYIGNSIYTYDTEGRLIEESVSNGIKVRYTYDAKGNKIAESASDLAKTEGPRFLSVDRITQYSYDGRGNVVEQAYYSSDGSKAENPLIRVHRITRSYDDKGLEVGRSLYNLDGTIRSKANFTYNSQGNLLEETYQNDKGLLTNKYQYKYEFDNQGNWTKQVKSEWVARDGKSFYVPKEITYRTISYY